VPVGFVAFGTATPPGAVPTTGSATLDALVAGLTLDGDGEITGTATLQFDFAAGTLTGKFDPVLGIYGGTNTYALGTYDFVNTVHGVGSTTFSGSLQRTGAPSLGAFDGIFTGPAAQELMARWHAPYLHPITSSWSNMFGVWVGRKP
jgi:hypothetical protein